MDKMILELVMLFSLNSAPEATAPAENYEWVLDEIEAAAFIAPLEALEQRKIRIYDLENNTFEEYNEEAFILNDLPTEEMEKILNSDFLFEAEGSSFYLKG